jgi:hypothetical protein
MHTLHGQQRALMPYPRRRQKPPLDVHQALIKAGTSVNSGMFQPSDTHHKHKKRRTVIKRDLLALAMADAMRDETCIKS